MCRTKIYPAHLKRKRQKTNGDPVHLLLQQQQDQHQNDHPDGRQAKANCWNTTNIPAIKTEPRDPSPQSFAMYRAPPELTPSPQPLSPSAAYAQNTPSPYNLAPTLPAGAQNRQQLISPNQQYNATGAGGGNNAPPRMDISEYNTFSQQAQQYHSSNFGGAGAAHWESKFNSAIPAGNNLSNLHSTNPFTMHNLLAPANVSGAPVNGPNNTGWNVTSNNFHPQQHPQHLQQQYPPHPTQGEGAATNNNGSMASTAGAVPNSNTVGNTNHTEHGLSNLLTIDSEQYVRINSEDQQMLRLNSEDLQISNLSIST